MISAATNRNNSVHPCFAACTLKTSSNQRHEAVNPQILAPIKRATINAKRTIEEELENELEESRLSIDELAPAFAWGSCKEVDSAALYFELCSLCLAV